MQGFTNLEDRMLGPEGLDALSGALASVRAVGAEVRSSIAAGLPHGDFAHAEKILAAVDAAEQILLNSANLKGA